MLLSLARVGVGLRVKAVVDNVYTSVVLQKSSQEVAVSGVTLSEKKKKNIARRTTRHGTAHAQPHVRVLLFALGSERVHVDLPRSETLFLDKV